MRDADPTVRGFAIRKLHAMWVPIAVKDLPRTFSGEHDGQGVDLDQKDAVAQLTKACEQGDASAAYLLGLLRHKEAVPLLRQLAKSRNIYAQYTAARAMIDCGDHDGARAVLEGIIRSQLAIYGGGPEGGEPFYAAASCRALIELGEGERGDGLKKMISLMGYMERSEKPNDEAQLSAVRQHLAAVTGVYFYPKTRSESLVRAEVREVTHFANASPVSTSLPYTVASGVHPVLGDRERSMGSSCGAKCWTFAKYSWSLLPLMRYCSRKARSPPATSRRMNGLASSSRE